MGKIFGNREIENYKKGSGKNGVTIEKTGKRSLQFKNKRYLHVDTVQIIKAKDLCKVAFM